jgi:nitrogen regulatory protein PII
MEGGDDVDRFCEQALRHDLPETAEADDEGGAADFVEVAVSSDRAAKTVEAITAAARTGLIGDGKIFVMTLEHAVRIRTSETDSDAL